MIIAAAAAGGVLGIIILLIMIVCCCLRRRRMDTKTEHQSLEPSATTADAVLREVNRTDPGYQSHDPAYSTNPLNPNQPQSGSALQNEILIYAKPNKTGSVRDTTDKVKLERKLSHYEEVGEQFDCPARDESNKSSADINSFCEDMPSVYDDVSVPTHKTNVFSQSSASKRSANVEGLMYADLEISTNKNSNDVDRNKSVIGNDNLTVYSEVKM